MHVRTTEDVQSALPVHPPKLLDQVWDVISTKYYSIKTEQAYVHWIRRFILFRKKRHPKEMGEKEITEFITYLAVKDKVAASLQNSPREIKLNLNEEVSLYLYITIMNKLQPFGKVKLWGEDGIKQKRFGSLLTAMPRH